MTTEFFLENRNVESTESLPSPAQLHQLVPATEQAFKTVAAGRRALERILNGADSRMFAVVGPCSVHDTQAALDYAQRLKGLADELNDALLIVMRVYFEKPRTTVGWKGLINDPEMDDSFQIEKGLKTARQLMVDINTLGLPIGTEALDPLSPQYLGDLISWSAIGARTTESQTHREMASGLSTPVGFKNGTDGSLKVALNALTAAATPHAFLGVDSHGQIAVVRTRGNAYGHLILRGGAVPNYDEVSVQTACADLRASRLPERVVVDCSHGNSSKDHRRQPEVLRAVAEQRARGNKSLMGVMLESNLVEGAQKACSERTQLTYGQSVTDACIGWDDTARCLRDLALALRQR